MSSLGILNGSLGKELSVSSLIRTIGIVYICLTPVFQYFIYEIRNPEEYYFYYNMGLSKLFLWVYSLIISTVIGLTLSVT
jgi:hypothetical protein